MSLMKLEEQVSITQISGRFKTGSLIPSKKYGVHQERKMDSDMPVLATQMVMFVIQYGFYSTSHSVSQNSYLHGWP